MKSRYMLLPLILLALAAQLGLAQGGPGMPPPAQGTLYFVSQPPPFARVGVPYQYSAKAVSKVANAVIHYFYVNEMMGSTNPLPPIDGFSIDSVTGVVTWTPKAPGWYHVSILARADNGEYGIQHFAVTVTSGNGLVQGKVSDTTGAGIPGVVVELLQAVNVSPMVMGYYSYAAKTDLHGNYRISNVDPGDYKVHANSPDPRYASQWYDGKATPMEANVITVKDSPDVTPVNFTLRGGITPQPLISVSGMVEDTATAPVAGAEVFFVQTGFALNMNSTIDDYRRMFDLAGPSLDFRMDGHSLHVFRAMADSLGQYNLKVVAGAYVAFARAKGYSSCFYLNQSDMLSATQLLLTRDTTGIDFVLRRLPVVPLGSISGVVMDTAKGIGVPSRIVAFRDRWSALDLSPVPRTYTVDSDSLGAYTLGNLPPGAYFVLAVPMGSYAPAFYNAADTACPFWRRASRVLVNGNDVTGVDIYVHEIPSIARGYTGILGTVHSPSGPEFSPAGTIIYAVSAAGVAGFGIADASGHFEIAGLAPGTYTVTPDLPGFDPVASISATVSYAGSGTPQFATVDLSMNAVVLSVEESGGTTPVKFELSQNYPNPFNPSTTIEYTVGGVGGQGSGTRVKLTVYDVLGREVAVLADGVQSAGQHSVTFDASSLSTGAYFYRLSAGALTSTKKMLLVK